MDDAPEPTLCPRVEHGPDPLESENNHRQASCGRPIRNRCGSCKIERVLPSAPTLNRLSKLAARSVMKALGLSFSPLMIKNVGCTESATLMSWCSARALAA